MHHSANAPVAERVAGESKVTERISSEPKEFTMRDAQMRMIPLSAFVVFCLFGLFTYFIEGDVGYAAGVGAFMAFWIGGGFGAIMGGALWNHHNEASLYKD